MSRSVLVRKIRSHGRRGRSRSLVLAPLTAGLALAMALPATAATATTATAATATRATPATLAAAHAAAAKIAALPKSGIWTGLSAGMTVESPPPALWVAPNGVGWDVFPRQIAPNVFTYEAVQVGTTGKVIKGPADINAKGQVTVKLAATAKAGGYKISVTAPFYATAGASVSVKK